MKSIKCKKTYINETTLIQDVHYSYEYINTIQLNF